MNELMTIDNIEAYLQSVKNRKFDSEIDVTYRHSLKQLKTVAVSQNDQAQAKLLWCYETILKIQNLFLAAFDCLKNGLYYDAWCLLERTEINLCFLERHYPLDERNDPFSLDYISKHVEQFQEIFPYEMFFSPGFISIKKECTMCGAEVSIRKPCRHITGEIYDGEMCGRKVTEVQFYEISLVTNPVQKYSVAFHSSDGQEKIDPHNCIDPYNYTDVEYVVRGLQSPWDTWEITWAHTERAAIEFKEWPVSDICPCGSGESFGECCISKEKINVLYRCVHYSVPPPPDLPQFETLKVAKSRAKSVVPEVASRLTEMIEDI